MTRTFKQHAAFSLVVTTLALALGGCFGYLFGCAMVIHTTRNALEEYALRIQGLVSSFVNESYQLLLTANASPYPYCSDAELAYFRSLIFRAEYVHDLGRMRENQINCSAIMGRLAQPKSVSPADIVNPDGTRTHRNLPPSETDALQSNGVQLGNSYIVFSNYRYSHLGSTSIHYIRTSPNLRTGQIGVLRGKAINLDQQVLTQNGDFWRNGVLYATRCSTQKPSCTVTYISLREALQNNRFLIRTCAFAGGLAGLLFGLFCSTIYRRSKGLERQLRRAIHKNDVQIVYQPIVDLSSGKTVEAEALARWTDEDGFSISPETFIRIAEEHGFIGEFTEMVVRQVLRDFGEFLPDHPDFRININVAAADLADAKFLPMLANSLRQAGVSPSNLAIEVTESSTARVQIARETIHLLREAGHSVQIDDFGTGYSSLAYLHDLAVDAIKIDRVFTQAIGTESVTVGILPQILAMAKILNLQVIAEGIETVDQAGYFAGSEIPVLGQGWLFGRPVAAQAFLEQLAQASNKVPVAQ
jgi:sensor c-di-GMP phosphodiesterase-like protein